MPWPSSSPPSASTIALLWDALHTTDQATSAALSDWCLRPVRTAQGRMLWQAGHGAVLAPGGWTEGVEAALLAAGCRVWDDNVAPPRGELLPATAMGVLCALRDVAGGAWVSVTASQRDQLRAFLLQVLF